MKKWKKVHYHLLAWACWLVLSCSWAIFSGTQQPLLPLTYNVISLVLVFYGVRWMAGKYWQRIEKQTAMYVGGEGLKMTYPGIKVYVQQWAFLGVIAIVLAYIIGSWFMDGLFAQTGHLPGRMQDFYYYTYARWSAEALVVCGGNVMAAIEYHFRKQAEKEKILEEGYNEQFRINQLYNQKLKQAIDDYSKTVQEMRQRMNGK